MQFYVLDTENPTSIVSAIRAARENARTLRPLISTEMWTQINVFYNRLAALGPAEIAPHNLTRLCSMVKEACQAHTGITEGTFYRDQGWYFYQMGKHRSAPTRPPACSISSTMCSCPSRTVSARPWTSASGTWCCAPPPATTPSAGSIRVA